MAKLLVDLLDTMITKAGLRTLWRAYKNGLSPAS